MGRIVVHGAQRALDNPVTLKSPPLWSAEILFREPHFEHSGQEQIEQAIERMTSKQQFSYVSGEKS